MWDAVICIFLPRLGAESHGRRAKLLDEGREFEGQVVVLCPCQGWCQNSQADYQNDLLVFHGMPHLWKNTPWSTVLEDFHTKNDWIASCGWWQGSDRFGWLHQDQAVYKMVKLLVLLGWIFLTLLECGQLAILSKRRIHCRAALCSPSSSDCPFLILVCSPPPLTTHVPPLHMQHALLNSGHAEWVEVGELLLCWNRWCLQCSH